jgi:flagellar biosynthesis protein FlhG
MSDQANRLRELAFTATVSPPEASPRLPIVVVTGAKTRVGATTVAVNLAAALADRGQRVLVVDAAEHRNDLADVAGVGRDFDYAVSDVMTGKCGIEEAVVDGVGMRVLAAHNRLAARRERDFSPRRISNRRNSPIVPDSRGAQQRLLAELESLRDEVDLVVIDAGCGLTAWTRRFWMRSALVVLVTTTNDASRLDAYAALKHSVADGIRPAIRLLVNQCDSDQAADDVRRRMQSACQRFLSCQIDALPPLPRQHDSAASGLRVWEMPNSAFGHATLWLGRAVGEILAAPANEAATLASAVPELHETFLNAK